MSGLTTPTSISADPTPFALRPLQLALADRFAQLLTQGYTPQLPYSGISPFMQLFGQQPGVQRPLLPPPPPTGPTPMLPQDPNVALYGNNPLPPPVGGLLGSPNNAWSLTPPSIPEPPQFIQDPNFILYGNNPLPPPVGGLLGSPSSPWSPTPPPIPEPLLPQPLSGPWSPIPPPIPEPPQFIQDPNVALYGPWSPTPPPIPEPLLPQSLSSPWSPTPPPIPEPPQFIQDPNVALYGNNLLPPPVGGLLGSPSSAWSSTPPPIPEPPLPQSLSSVSPTDAYGPWSPTPPPILEPPLPQSLSSAWSPTPPPIFEPPQFIQDPNFALYGNNLLPPPVSGLLGSPSGAWSPTPPPIPEPLLPQSIGSVSPTDAYGPWSPIPPPIPEPPQFIQDPNFTLYGNNPLPPPAGGLLGSPSSAWSPTPPPILEPPPILAPPQFIQDPNAALYGNNPLPPPVSGLLEPLPPPVSGSLGPLPGADTRGTFGSDSNTFGPFQPLAEPTPIYSGSREIYSSTPSYQNQAGAIQASESSFNPYYEEFFGSKGSYGQPGNDFSTNLDIKEFFSPKGSHSQPGNDFPTNPTGIEINPWGTAAIQMLSRFGGAPDTGFNLPMFGGPYAAPLLGGQLDALSAFQQLFDPRQIVNTNQMRSAIQAGIGGNEIYNPATQGSLQNFVNPYDTVSGQQRMALQNFFRPGGGPSGALDAMQMNFVSPAMTGANATASVSGAAPLPTEIRGFASMVGPQLHFPAQLGRAAGNAFNPMAGQVDSALPGNFQSSFQQALDAPRADLTQLFQTGEDVLARDLERVRAQSREEASAFGLNPGAADRTRIGIEAAGDVLNRFRLGQQQLGIQAFQDAENRRLGALGLGPSVQTADAARTQILSRLPAELGLLGAQAGLTGAQAQSEYMLRPYQADIMRQQALTQAAQTGLTGAQAGLTTAQMMSESQLRPLQAMLMGSQSGLLGTQSAQNLAQAQQTNALTRNIGTQNQLAAMPFLQQADQQALMNFLSIANPAAQRASSNLGLLSQFSNLPFQQAQAMYGLNEHARMAADTELQRMMQEFARTQGGGFNQLMQLFGNVQPIQTSYGPSPLSQAGQLGLGIGSLFL